MASKLNNRLNPGTISFISLGCARNLVDTEVMLGLLKEAGFNISERLEGSDVALINTCSFIEEAKEESIGVILQAAQLKKEGKIRHLVVAGCLPQRYRDELPGLLEEVDGFVGIGELEKIVRVINDVSAGKRPVKVSQPRLIWSPPRRWRGHLRGGPRYRLTPQHYAYVKIVEGCQNKCSYCVIPKIKGKHTSITIESILGECGQLLRNSRISEINLIGQDTTLYGWDRYGKSKLTHLLKQICRLKRSDKNKFWLRLLYAHPSHVEDGLIKTIADEKNICKYIDLPLQHINDRILKRMNRSTTKKDIVRLIESVRRNIPGVTLRTTFIVGFPGETEEEFNELLDFIQKTRFERLGAFTYSREEGTPAAKFPHQVPEKVKKERFHKLMSLQQKISQKTNQSLRGEEIEALVDEVDKKQNLIIARSQGDAPEVDGTVYIKSKIKKPKPGDFLKVRITDTYEYDLVGELL